MKFSVCIPNYNYARYLRRTIQSVLEQDADFEIVISDNASTDDSIDVVRSFGDARIKYRVNRCNVGFARNLDKAAQMATGDVIIMLSSDDLMLPGALRAYRELFESLGDARERSILTSSAQVVDPDDRVTGALPPDPKLWVAADQISSTAAPAGARLYRVDGDELLRRCIRITTTPFNFLATAIPRAIYEKVEGYGGARLINPDKWFHWRVLGLGGVEAYYLDHPFFAYRWHPQNQTAQQAASGALKIMVDEYTDTFEFDSSILYRLGLRREDLERAFIEHDVARRGLGTLARIGPRQARRIWTFGLAAYPQHATRNPKMWLLAGLLGLGPLARPIAQRLYSATTHLR